MIPSVELSIFVYNQWEKTLRLLNSIKENTSYSNYKITVIDNGSTDQTVNELKNHPETNPIFKENLSFAVCNNFVLDGSKADYVCVITSEVEVSKDWLLNLVKKMEIDEDIGIISPVKKNDENLIIGGKLRDDATCINLFERVRNREVIEWFHSCCFLIRKDVINKIGLFDERFQVRYYEDIDFCIRVKEAGFKLVCPQDIVISFYDDELPELKYNQEENRVLFVEKNKDWLIKNKGRAVKRKRRFQKKEI